MTICKHITLPLSRNRCWVYLAQLRRIAWPNQIITIPLSPWCVLPQSFQEEKGERGWNTIEVTKLNPQLHHQTQAKRLSAKSGWTAGSVTCSLPLNFFLSLTNSLDLFPHCTVGHGVDALYNLVNGRRKKGYEERRRKETPSLILSSSWLCWKTCLPFGNFSLQCILCQKSFLWPVPWATCQHCYHIMGFRLEGRPPTAFTSWMCPKLDISYFLHLWL